jgi:hypothetical protein
MANSLIVGYTNQDESRSVRGDGSCSRSWTSSTSEHRLHVLRLRALHAEQRAALQDVPGAEQLHEVRQPPHADVRRDVERYESENVFFPGSQSAYVYNSLNDFYTDANDYLANPNRTVSPVTLRRFQVRWSNIPGLEKPVQPLEVLYAGAYAQDEWRHADNLKLTPGCVSTCPASATRASPTRPPTR